MLDTKELLVINEILENIDKINIKNIYLNIYKDYNQNIKQIFSYFHQEINDLFSRMNDRATGGRHFLADDSRRLLYISEKLEELQFSLRDSNLSFELVSSYSKHLKYCETFLQSSNGSEIPDDYQKITIIKYESIFFMKDKVMVKSKVVNQNFEAKLIGSGSYANVFKYKDEYYNTIFAIKKLKKDTDEKELARFKREYQLLNEINHPNVLKAYNYIDDNNSYIMEYCDYTLKKYYDLYNGDTEKLSFTKRKKIALQFLKSLQVLHGKDILHRDISYNNILLKEYDGDMLLVKISDFGLIKDKMSDLTSTDSQIKGTIIDDTLVNFKAYNIKNEIYVIGVMLFYIFTGKQRLELDKSLISKIVEKCIDRNHDKRYNNVIEIIEEINSLKSINENEEKPEKKLMLKNDVLNEAGLNELAVDILTNAIEGNANIFKFRSILGLHIQCGKKNYEPSNTKEEANIEYALELLIDNDYIRATNYKNEIFKVTKKGFELFD